MNEKKPDRFPFLGILALVCILGGTATTLSYYIGLWLFLLEKIIHPACNPSLELWIPRVLMIATPLLLATFTIWIMSESSEKKEE